MRSAARACCAGMSSANLYTCGRPCKSQRAMRCSQRCPQQTLFRKYTHKGTFKRVQLTEICYLASGHLEVTSRG